MQINFPYKSGSIPFASFLVGFRNVWLNGQFLINFLPHEPQISKVANQWGSSGLICIQV